MPHALPLSLATVEVSSIKTAESGAAVTGDELTREYKTAENVQLQPELLEKLKTFFGKMDSDKNGVIDEAEAIAFWGKNFAKVRHASVLC